MWLLNDSFQYHFVNVKNKSDFLSYYGPLMWSAWRRRGQTHRGREKNLVTCNFQISCASIHSCLIARLPGISYHMLVWIFSTHSSFHSNQAPIYLSSLLPLLSAFSTLSLTLPKYPVVSTLFKTVWQNHFWESMGVTGHNWFTGAKSLFRVPPGPLWTNKAPLRPSSFSPRPYISPFIPCAQSCLHWIMLL